MIERKKVGTVFILILILAFNFLFAHLTFYHHSQKISHHIENEPELGFISKIFDWDSQITRGVEENPLSIAIGDVNNDGEFDIITANNDSNSISILLWNITAGDWIIYNKTVGNGPCDIVIGDANNDGFFDIAVANNLSNEVTIFRWNSSVQEWNSSSLGVGNQPSSVSIGDANNDGLNEIIVANYADDNVSIFTWNILLENWDPERTESVGNGPVAVEIADVNRDGLMEIVMANQTHISLMEWNETGTKWIFADSITAGVEPSALAVGDANNDGQIDIIITSWDDDSMTLITWNQTALQWDFISKTVGIRPSAIAVGDVNSDGQNDVVTADNGNNNVSILLWNESAGNWDVTSKRVGQGPMSVIIGDVNNDGLKEISTANSLDNTVSILLWNTTRGELAAQRITRSVGGNPAAVAVGDANNDGELDIVTANSADDNVSILIWNETLNDWNPQISLGVKSSPTSVYIGDANNDGMQDIITVSSEFNSYNVSIILWNTSTNSWDSYVTRPISDFGAWDVIIADANNDGANDIVGGKSFQPHISLLIWNKTISDWNPYIFHLIGGIPYQIEVADINNDGFNDLIAAGNDSAPAARVWFQLWNSSAGNWSDYSTLTITTTPPTFTPAIAIGDANNDGLNELIVTNMNNERVEIRTWNETLATWNSPISKLVEEDPISVDIGDINNDGQHDIVTSNKGTGQASVLLWNATNQDWETQIGYSAGNNPRSIIIRDVTGDGMNDLTVSNYQDDTISILEFNRYPYISSRAVLQLDPKWGQNEDFGSFFINLTTYEMDFEDEKINLTWFVSGLNNSLVTVSGESSADDVLTFYSIGNVTGTDTFTLYLKDRHDFLDGVLITIIVTPINDVPIILSKGEIQNSSIWVQSRDVRSFSIDLTDYEFDVEDDGADLNWFVSGLNPNIATVEGEYSTNDILTFRLRGKGTDSFLLILVDSGGATANLTITLTVEPSLIRILSISLPIIIAGILISIFLIVRRRRRAHRDRYLKALKTIEKSKT